MGLPFMQWVKSVVYYSMKGSEIMGLIIGIILFVGGLLNLYFSGASILSLGYIIVSLGIIISSLPFTKKLIAKLNQWLKPVFWSVALLVLLIISLISKGENPARYEEAINQAASDIQAGELKKAEKVLEDLYEDDPMNGAVNLNLAALYLSQGKTEKAKPFLDGALPRLYHDEMLYFNYGIYYYQLEDYPNALINFEKAIQINPSFAAANIYAGTLSYELRDLKKAIYHLENARYLMPENPETLLFLGKANKDMMNYQVAEEVLNLALERATSKDLESQIEDELDELESFKEGVLQ